MTFPSLFLIIWMSCQASLKDLRSSFSGVLSLCVCVCVCVCCHSWPELNHLRDYGDLSLYLPWEKGDLISVSAWDGCGLGSSVRPSHVLWNLTGPDMSHTRIHTATQSGGDTLFINCVSCDLIPPQENTPTHTHTHTNTHPLKHTEWPVKPPVCIMVRTEQFALPDWWSLRLSEQQKGFVEVD